MSISIVLSNSYIRSWVDPLFDTSASRALLSAYIRCFYRDFKLVSCFFRFRSSFHLNYYSRSFNSFFSLEFYLYSLPMCYKLICSDLFF
jgi:hypothetical protein